MGTMERLNTDLLAVINHRGRIVGTVHRERLVAAFDAAH